MNNAKVFDVMVDVENRLYNHFYRIESPFFGHPHIVPQIEDLDIGVIPSTTMPHKSLHVITRICKTDKLTHDEKVMTLEGLACDLSLVCLELGFLK